MKDLRCKACGGKLKLDESKKYAYCEYCKSQYEMDDNNITINLKLDDSIKNVLDNNNKIKQNSQEAFKSVKIIFIIIGFVIIAISIFMFSQFNKTNKSTTNNNINNINTDNKNEFEIMRFNSVIEMYKGTQSSFFVKKLLDEVNTSNKKSDKKIIVIYNGDAIIDLEEIINIKSSLGKDEYEIVLNYDADGYINEVEIR